MSGTVIQERSVLFSSELGVVNTKVSVVKGYDVEDFVARKTLAQGRRNRCSARNRSSSVSTP